MHWMPRPLEYEEFWRLGSLLLCILRKARRVQPFLVNLFCKQHPPMGGRSAQSRLDPNGFLAEGPRTERSLRPYTSEKSERKGAAGILGCAQRAAANCLRCPLKCKARTYRPSFTRIASLEP